MPPELISYSISPCAVHISRSSSLLFSSPYDYALHLCVIALRHNYLSTFAISAQTEIRLCESLSKKPGPTPSQLASSANSQPASGRGSPQPPSVAEAAQIAKAKEQEREKKQRDVFAPENWDSLLIDQFDGQQGEEYGLLLVSWSWPVARCTC